MEGATGRARRFAPTRILCLGVLIGCLGMFAVPAAQARDFNCDASAFRLQLGTAAPIEPITANRGASSCKAVASKTSTTIGPVTAGALVAQTTAPSGQEAHAVGGLAQLTVGIAALAGVPLPTTDAINQIPPVTVPVPATDQLLGLPPTVTVDIRPAVTALLQALTTAPLLDVAGSTATANAVCDGTNPKLTGSTKVVSVKVLGQELPTDAAVQQALTIYNGQTIDPSALDPSKFVLPPGLSFTDPALGAILEAIVKPVVSALPAISLPASLLTVSITPSSQKTTDGGLTQQGLGVSLAVLGNNVVNAVVGEARVSVDSVKCSVQTPSGLVAPIQVVNHAALSCASRRLALINVIDRGHYVSLYGAADKRLAGKRIAIRSRADGRVVARPRVAKNGLFKARAPLPPQRWRYTNKARYLAVHGKDKSLDLKLHRRMVFSSVRSRKGKVTLRGIVTQPWTSPVSTIVVRQRLTCHRQKIVARLHPDASGRFQVTLKAPKKGDVGVYRATTKVAYPGGGPDFRTYTLPGLVRFAR